MSGPYVTEAEALREPMPRAVALLHDAGLVRSGDPERLVHRTQLAALTEACSAAELGAYDRQVLEWLARWESATVQVVADLITRAARVKPH